MRSAFGCALAAALLAPLSAGAQQWQQVPLTTRANVDYGARGGEGGQRILGLASDRSGRFLLLATEAGGLYRSFNSGATWQPANTGFMPCGAADVAIDPNNPGRAIAVGSSTARFPWHGLWLTTDYGASWTPRLLKSSFYGPMCQLAYDPSSRDRGRSLVAYWSGAGDRSGSSITPEPIDTAGVPSAAPSEIYRTCRWGPSSWVLDGFVPGERVTVRLHFAEIDPAVVPGARRFDVRVNGAAALAGFDMLQAAGRSYRALVREVSATAGAHGSLRIDVANGTAGLAAISGFEGIGTTHAVRVNAGGAAWQSFRADHNATADSGLFKTVDGGETWHEIQPCFGDSIVRVHPTRRWVYAANGGGLFRSKDGGADFTRIFEGSVTGVSLSPAAPDRVVLCQASRLWVSTDAGDHWNQIAASGLPVSAEPGAQNWYNVSSSPAKADQLLIESGTAAGLTWARSPHYVSRDGGAHWSPVRYSASQSWAGRAPDPGAVRQSPLVWHPTNAAVAWSAAGDYVVKSGDFGATFAWDSAGFCAFGSAGRFSFGHAVPGSLLLGSEGLNGALTADGGATWTASAPLGNPEIGYVYAGLPLASGRLAAGVAADPSGDRRLALSADAGKSWRITPLTGSTYYHVDTSISDPADPRTAFFDNWRTGDGGESWHEMAGCDGVFAADTRVGMLVGRLRSALVESADHGRSWQVVSQADGGWLLDAAVDPNRSRIYVTTDARHLLVWDRTARTWTDLTGRLPADNNGQRAAQTVACDPTDPAVVYAGRSDVYNSSAAIMRSFDGGATWKSLIRREGSSTLDGPRQAVCIRVNPATREAWITTRANGVWKIGPPGGKQAGKK